eukprot:760413-Rhodomonas_salina.3
MTRAVKLISKITRTDVLTLLRRNGEALPEAVTNEDEVDGEGGGMDLDDREDGGVEVRREGREGDAGASSTHSPSSLPNNGSADVVPHSNGTSGAAEEGPGGEGAGRREGGGAEGEQRDAAAEDLSEDTE